MTEAKRSATGLYIGGSVVVVAALLGLLVLSHTRASQAREEVVSRAKVAAAGPKVTVVKASRSSGMRHVEVQAEARPYASVTLYPKVSGYLAEIRVDKGDPVKKGDLLARIEAPEIDKQVIAARADAKNKRVNADRSLNLVKPGVVSQQESDLAVASADVAEAQEQAITVQARYETLRAPFDGVVTARYADPGALLQAATSAVSGAQPVLTLSDLDRLRVYSYVTQADAPFVKVGDVAKITLPGEQSHAAMEGKVARVSSELDLKTRMMLVEVDLDNRDRRVVAGSFVRESLALSAPSLVTVPVAALVLRGNRPFVAVVSSEGKVTYQPVKLADQDGLTARIEEGLKEGQVVALNVGDSLTDGAQVQPIMTGEADVGAAR
jgi:membrane fusion protein, multidrug efflux system